MISPNHDSGSVASSWHPAQKSNWKIIKFFRIRILSKSVWILESVFINSHHSNIIRYRIIIDVSRVTAQESLTKTVSDPKIRDQNCPQSKIVPIRGSH